MEVLKAKFADFSLTYSIGGQISFDVFPMVCLCQVVCSAYLEHKQSACCFGPSLPERSACQ